MPVGVSQGRIGQPEISGNGDEKKSAMSVDFS